MTSIVLGQRRRRVVADLQVIGDLHYVRQASSVTKFAQ